MDDSDEGEMDDNDDLHLGPGFWLSTIGILIAGIGGAILVFILFGRVWYSWGLLGGFIVLGAILIPISYIIDRRDAHRRSGLT
jgi:polyferredoxin